MTAPARPDDAVLWRCVEETLDRIVGPALAPGYERDSARQLAGLARYALGRRAAREAERAAEVGGVLGSAAVAGWPDVLARASNALVGGAADPRLRECLMRYLAEDIVEAKPLLDTFSGHDVTDVPADVADVPEAAALREWLAAALDAPVDQFSAALMVGGHSRRMLDVRATSAGRQHALVVRIEQGGMFATEGLTEARVMAALSDAGLPVARVRWIETRAEVLGQPFFVMDRVAGSATHDDRALDEYIRALHELHQAEPTLGVAGLGPVPDSPVHAVALALDHWTAVYEANSAVRIPLLDEAGAWLRAHLRPTGAVSIVHGDPGPGNFLHDGERIAALTDWELAHYGDAAEDWTYFGAIRARKLHDVATWRAIIRAQTGVEYDDVTWGCWHAFNLYKGACVNLTALRLFRDGITTTPNLLAIGIAVQLRFLAQLVERIDELRPIMIAG